MEEKKEPQLETQTIVLMIGTALFFDALGFLLGFIFMGWAVDIFAGLTFWFWFYQHGIKFTKASRWGSFGLTFFIELWPGLGALPTWTFEVAYLAISSRVIEEVVKKVEKVPGGKNLTKVAAKAGIM